MAILTDTITSTATAASTLRLADILAAMNSTGASSSAMEAARSAIASLVSTAAGSSGSDAVRLFVVGLESEGEAATDMGAGAQMLAALDSLATSGSALPNVAIIVHLPGGGTGESVGATTWVVNAETGASSRYEQYEFNAFARVGNEVFATGRDGVYRLGGDTDAGEAIRAMVSFGKTAFDSPQLKRVPYAYLGVSSDGRMYMKVIVAARTYVYRTRGYSPELSQQRVDIGRGLTATYWEFEVYNADGADFTLDTVEFVPVSLERRIP